MYIEEIIIDGFKSYPKRTVLSGFDPHFNAITGLNGSGKSNILDSICFVLGITNLSQVRVGNLQALVYKQGQAGVTKASVTLVFNNDDKKGSPLGYENFAQLTVTRQVVIGGNNKYLINGHVAQKQQVENLFHSVQLNVNNPHFLIMQGRITKVLNMKPAEILGMIEEAAGTRMFETKKQSSLKTLEKKQTKVEEINKILEEEITPTLERLRGEKSTYLTWNANNTEMERLERFCVANDFRAAEETVAAGEGELRKVEDIVQGLADEVERLKGIKEEKEAEAVAVSEKRGEQASGELKAAAKKEEALSKDLVKASADLANRKAALKAELKTVEALKEAQAEGGTAQAAKDDEVEQFRLAVSKAEEKVAEAEATHKACALEYQSMCAGVAQGEGDEGEQALTLTGQMAAAAAEASSADTAQEQSAVRVKHLKKTATEVASQAKKAEKEVEGLRKEHAAAVSRSESARKELSGLRYDPAEAQQLQEEIETASSSLAPMITEAESLSAQIAGRLSFEYRDPAKGFDRSKVKGLVAKLITVTEPDAATALEVAAGGKLYQVVVDNEQTGKLLLQRGELRRRVTIIPLSGISHRLLDANQLNRAASLAQRNGGSAKLALELVGFDDKVRAAVEHVFGTTLICDRMDTARQVAFDRGVRARTVTLEGDSFEPQGTLTGGSKAQLGTILAKLTRLREITEAVGALKQRKATAEQKLKALEKDMQRHQELSQALELADQKSTLLSTRLAGSSHAQLLARLTELEASVEEAVEAGKTAQKTAAAARAKRDQLQREEAAFRSKREAALAALGGKVDKAKAKVTAATEALGKAKQKLQVAELEAETLRNDFGGLGAQLLAAEKSTDKLAEDAEAVAKSVQKWQSDYGLARDALAALKEQQTSLDNEVKALRKEADKYAKKMETAELDRKKAEHRFTKMQREGESAGKFVQAMLKKHPWIETERQFFGKAGTDYDFGARDVAGAQRRLKALQTEQATLGRKINKKVMGMIEKAETEYQELVRKKAVIEGDKKKIYSVIKELDDKKNQALQTTWVKVNRDFGSIFSTLLPGTSAKLEPPEGATVMEGLEVKVAFGTVWKESLTELSGGQRSLLALSLILALLLFKPAPMYILDEVDAALDLSHTQNIGSMLKTHFSHSQFIVVSLKEGMFSNANVIFTTKFVEGVSTVHRALVAPPANRPGGGNSTAGKGGAAARKRAKVGENAAPVSG